MSRSLANGGNHANRRGLDFYPTPANVTQALVDFFSIKGLKIWEPACGDGAMSVVLEKAGNNVISTDIRQSGYGIPGIDFLLNTKECDAIITNPPFFLSEKFIEHAIGQAVFVAMLLKSQYWHSSKRLLLFHRHRPSYVMPLTWRPDFLNGERGGAPTMEMLWTVWTPNARKTYYIPLRKPPKVTADELFGGLASPA